MQEFALITKYFGWGAGIGDDAAIIDITPDLQTVTSVDSLIEGVHFPADTAPKDIAHKALAVNLSDLAAMGATPKYFTLALTIPDFDDAWLRVFSSSLRQLSQQYGITLIGGDTTKGALSITINIIGEVKKNAALLRSGAKVGDLIFVSNTLGDAAFAWWQIQNNQAPNPVCLQHFNRPKPQVELGQKLLGLATSCIDISDGLTQDLGHILTASKVGATIDATKIPLSPALSDHIKKTNDYCLPLAGGDDYQLCFTLPPKKLPQLPPSNLTQIGIITQKNSLSIKGFTHPCQPYQHF